MCINIFGSKPIYKLLLCHLGNWTVISAESERCSSFSNAMKAGEPIYTKADTTLADGLAVPKVGINALATARSLVDKCVVVKEEFIAMAILR